MVQALDIAAAREHEGVRLVLSAGAPGPWGEAAKALLHVKQIPFVRVRQAPGEPNEELVAWTGIRNAPQIVAEDGVALHYWKDLIQFAEQRAPSPAMIPDDAEENALMFEIIDEIAGEGGFAWSRRLCLFQPIMAIQLDEPNPAIDAVRLMAEAYDYDDAKAAAAPARIAEMLGSLTRRLEAQQEAGSPYFIGDRLSALDIYWATFAALLSPLPEERCPMPAYLRQSYSNVDETVAAAISPELLRHRDFIYDEYLELPVQLVD